ncbi:hypothetical protein [Streptomyces sp. HUAS ZL42]|uniref:hypothetical protein n=1 Tax=Streptomyces sp. HUAS ZL42 TaxID=3231715 RepID=UPI00345EC424
MAKPSQSLHDTMRAKLGDRDTEESRRAYAAWKGHVEDCPVCGGALAPCTVEPVLWGVYRHLAGAR